MLVSAEVTNRTLFMGQFVLSLSEGHLIKWINGKGVVEKLLLLLYLTDNLLDMNVYSSQVLLFFSKSSLDKWDFLLVKGG